MQSLNPFLGSRNIFDFIKHIYGNSCGFKVSVFQTNTFAKELKKLTRILLLYQLSVLKRIFGSNMEFGSEIVFPDENSIHSELH